jgi:PTS system nitrogen regulatory IIA component
VGMKQLLNSKNIFLDCEISNKKRLFEKIGLISEESLGIPRGKVFDALMKREQLGSTGLGHGVALPHGKIDQLRDFFGLFFRLKNGIAFDSPDNEAVNLVFCLLCPENSKQSAHISNLGDIASFFSEKSRRSKLLIFPDNDSIFNFITNWDGNV